MILLLFLVATPLILYLNWANFPLSIKGKIGMVVGPIVGLFYYILLRLVNVDKHSILITPQEASTRNVTLKRSVKIFPVARVPVPNMKGITSGHSIFTEFKDLPEKHLTHELVHVEQIERNGFIKQMSLYGQEQALVGYDKNKYENEARQRSGQPIR